jgi:hypothetical protein
MKRGEVGAPPRGGCPSTAAALSLLYKVEVRLLSPLLSCHSLPPPVDPSKGGGLGETLSKLFLHHHHLIEV